MAQHPGQERLPPAAPVDWAPLEAAHADRPTVAGPSAGSDPSDTGRHRTFGRFLAACVCAAVVLFAGLVATEPADERPGLLPATALGGVVAVLVVLSLKRGVSRWLLPVAGVVLMALGILVGAAVPDGLDAAVILPLAGALLALSVLRGRILVVMFVVAYAASLGGEIAAHLVGGMSRLSDVGNVPVALATSAVMLAFTYGLGWWVSNEWLASSERTAHALTGQRQLLALNQRMVATLDPGRVLNLIADSLKSVVAYDNLTIYRVDRDQRLLRPVLARDRFASLILETTFALDQGITGWVVTNAEAQCINDAQRDPRMSLIPGTPAEAESLIIVPLMGGGDVVGTLNLGRMGGPESHFDQADFEIARLFAGQASVALLNAELHRAVATRADTDALTGLLNRGAFDDQFLTLIADPGAQPLILLMLDLDGFKAFNDRHGHPAGDALLQEVARSITAAVRTGDRVYRHGGDEFAVLLPATTAAVGARIAERIRAAIATLDGGAGTRVTASVGTASNLDDATTPDGLVVVADAALYRAKASGGNRVASHVVPGAPVLEPRDGHPDRRLDRTLADLRASEASIRALIDESADGILVSDASGRYVEANPALCRMLGYSRDEVLGMRAGDLTAADDPVGNQGMDERLAEAAGATGILVQRRYRKRDGTSLPVEVQFKVLPDGRQQRNVRDISERIRAEGERSRLDESLRRSARNLAEAQRIAHIGSWEWDLATDTAVRSEETYRIVGLEPGALPATNEAYLAFVHPDDRARVQASERAAINGGARYELSYRLVRPDGKVRIVREQADLMRDPGGTPLRWVGTIQDVTEHVAATDELGRLASALEQTADAVWMMGVDGNSVTYVNRAFSRLYGFERDEIVGHFAGLIDSGRQEPAFFEAIYASLAEGGTWTGPIVNRRKDGALVVVEAVISGIRDASGRLIGYMQTDRDVTRERALEGELQQRAREHDMILAALDRIDPGSTPEAIAADACVEMVRLPNVDSAFVIALEGDNRGLVLAVQGPIAPAFASNHVIPGSRAKYLAERATAGVWTEDWHARAEDGIFGQQISGTGLHTIAYAPLRGPSGVIGLVGLGNHAGEHDGFVEQLPVLTTLAPILGTLLSPALEARSREDDARANIRAILDAAAFTPFFQPIIELLTGSVVGYEALSRFASGTAPDVIFGLASRSGLGLELESATLRAAQDASLALPSGAYLTINASPAFIRSAALRTLLAGTARRIFIEITEHVAIDDYSALRTELAALGPTVGVAVDDAGAGFPSLHHILELAPSLVKLDISLVRGIDADPARQALIAGMSYFAVKRKLHLVAEGIETAGELEALLKLGIRYGQGFLLGRPQDGRGPGPWPTKVALPGVPR